MRAAGGGLTRFCTRSSGWPVGCCAEPPRPKGTAPHVPHPSPQWPYLRPLNVAHCFTCPSPHGNNGTTVPGGPPSANGANGGDAHVQLTQLARVKVCAPREEDQVLRRTANLANLKPQRGTGEGLGGQPWRSLDLSPPTPLAAAEESTEAGRAPAASRGLTEPGYADRFRHSPWQCGTVSNSWARRSNCWIAAAPSRPSRFW